MELEGIPPRLRRGDGGPGPHGGGLRRDLGRAGVPLQPGGLRPVVAAVGRGPVVGRREGPTRPRRPPLLLALRPLRHQLPPAARGPGQPGGSRRVRILDEGLPVATHGLDPGVRGGDRHRLPLPRPPLRAGDGAGDGGRLPAHAAGLRPGAPPGHGHPRDVPLGGDGPRLLERPARARRPGLAGAGGRAAGPGVPGEDGGGRRPAAADGVAGRDAPPAGLHPQGRPRRVDRRRGDARPDAPAAGPGVRGDPTPPATAAAAVAGRPLLPDGDPPGGRAPGRDPGRPGGRVGAAAAARAVAARQPDLGRRPPRPGDLRGDPGLRPAGGVARQPRLVARDDDPDDALLHPEQRPPGGPAGHPDPLRRAGVQVQPPLAQRLGPARDHRPPHDPPGRPGGRGVGDASSADGSAPALLPRPHGDPARRPDAPHPGPRRRPAAHAIVLLPRLFRRLGGRVDRRGRRPPRPLGRGADDRRRPRAGARRARPHPSL